MQEEITQRTVSLSVEAGKMTADLLQKAVKKVLEEMHDYYHAWEPLFSHLRATAIYGIITLESHHYI